MDSKISNNIMWKSIDNQSPKHIDFQHYKYFTCKCKKKTL